MGLRKGLMVKKKESQRGEKVERKDEVFEGESPYGGRTKGPGGWGTERDYQQALGESPKKTYGEQSGPQPKGERKMGRPRP